MVNVWFVISLFIPLVFPFWFVNNKHKRPRRTFTLFSIWFFIWASAVAGSFIQKPITTNLPQSSEVSSPVPNSSSLDSQGWSYQYTVYSQIKKAAEGGQTSGSQESKGQSSSTNTQGSANSQSSSSVSANSQSQSVQKSTANTGAMVGITIAEADNSPYTRKDYGSGWEVGSGCNIRARILQSTSLVSVQTSNGCTVTYGSWLDPYSGTTLTGNPYQGDDGTANDLDIDHVIPLKYVNSHGGYAWSSSAKIAYGKSLTAMANGVYIAVSASENRKKSDKGPADYYPPNPGFYCEYSRRWRDIARIYSISLSVRDYNKIQGVLSECGIV